MVESLDPLEGEPSRAGWLHYSLVIYPWYVLELAFIIALDVAQWLYQLPERLSRSMVAAAHPTSFSSSLHRMLATFNSRRDRCTLAMYGDLQRQYYPWSRIQLLPP